MRAKTPASVQIGGSSVLISERYKKDLFSCIYQKKAVLLHLKMFWFFRNLVNSWYPKH